MTRRLTHVRTGSVLADRVITARSWVSRARGLIGSTLRPGEALVLRPGRQVHTFFMSQPIDVVFCDGQDRVLAVSHMTPWRVSRWVRRAAYIIELPSGAAAEVEPGDLLDL